MALIVNVDGGSRGNPGPAGAGVVLRDEDGTLFYEAAFFLGRQTNNAAEYHALIRGLERALRCPPQPVTIRSDSELLVRQLTGEYRVKSPSLGVLHRQAEMLLMKLGRWSVRHIPREENQRADQLANLAMDGGRDVIVFDVDHGGEVRDAADREAEPRAEARDLAERPSETGPSAMGPASRAAAPQTSDTGRRAVRVTVVRAPRAGSCPAGEFREVAFTVDTVLPAGLCVHAAHTLVPTILAVLNTDPEEFAGVPTLTVRCTRPGCAAEFRLSPVRSPNGSSRAGGSEGRQGGGARDV